ncbi:MAG: hypothetical protein AAF215_27870 [Cyanobacteria bacterium P01_A01_bin.123]
MTNPLPQDLMGQRICETFCRYPWQFLLKHDDHNWVTETRYPLRPRLLWKHWQDAAVQIGVRFGSTTAYAMLDIDCKSDYLNSKAIADIEGALETLGIVRTVKVRSSWSGGIHIYIPLPEPVNTFNLAVAIKGALKAQGFTIAPGQLEIFPNRKTFGRCWLGEFVEYNGHRLPLQPGSGSALLNHDLQPVGGELKRFFWSWDYAAQAQDDELLKQALATAKRNRGRRRILTPLRQWREDLESEIGEGWTDFGQTNHILKSIATYGRVFLGLEGADLAQYTSDTAQSSPGYDRWCQHRLEINRRAASWARSVENYYYPAGTQPYKKAPYPVSVDVPNGNQQRADEASQRIYRAVIALHAELGDKLQTVTDWVKALVNKIGVSTKTLYKHKELWHPAVCDEGCKNFLLAGVLARNKGQIPSLEDHQPKPSQPLMGNVFLHLDTSMKSVALKSLPGEYLPPGEVWGSGGEKGLSTGLEGV